MARSSRGSGRLLSEEAVQGLIVLTLLAFAGVSAFSLLDLAGPFGRVLEGGLRSFFGWGVWLAPVFCFLVGALKLKQTPRRGMIGFGLVLFGLTILALLDLRVPLAVADRAADELGGGYLGLFLRFPLETVVGYWGAGLILMIVFIGTIIIIFDTTLTALATPPLRTLRAAFLFAADFGRGLLTRVPSVRPAAVPRLSNTSPAPAPAFVTRNVADAENEEDEEASDDEVEDGDDELGQTSLPGTEGGRRSSPTKSRYKPVPIDVPLTLLTQNSTRPTSGDIKEQKMTIQKTFESFGINVEMDEVNVGPTVTQYTLKPSEGVKLAAITGLSNDLSLALAAHPIRIEAPIPGRSLVGIEVPNEAVAMVHLREILESAAFQQRRGNLMLALGKDVAGGAYVVNLERMPHLLVAGATGSGKSVALNTIILSLLYQNGPAEMKMILVDPKRVEFHAYQHIPHLLTPVITEVPATVNALKWALREMDRRFILLQQTGDRNIQSYNQHAEEKMPYLVIVIDELADLMVAAAAEVEAAIIRLAQMARAVGMHLVLATQRPSVDVITGLIKANITARIAFSVASLMDSRTILDTGGAEKLIGRGDLLYVSAEVPKPKRLQGCFVSDEEIRAVVEFLKSKATPDYIEGITTKQPATGGFGGFSDDDSDDLLGEAEALVVQAGKASASFLQRRLRVGYARAARLLDLLEAKGVIGPGDGAKPRDVLIQADLDGMLPVEMNDEEASEAENSPEYKQ